MTQDIRISRHGASGAEAVTLRAALQDKDQAEGGGVRTLTVLFIGFAVYLKSFFNASQAEETGAMQDQPGSIDTETASLPAKVNPSVAAAPVRAESPADSPNVAQDVQPGLAILVGRGLSLTTKDSSDATAMDAGRIAPDPTLSDITASFLGAAESFRGRGQSSDEGPEATTAAPNLADGPTSPPTDTGTPEASRIYDISALFHDLAVPLQGRPDSRVDHVTDLAIGDLMRDLTLDEFRAHLGPVPQDPGRPLERLVSVLTDDGSRDAFLARTGLMQGEPLDVSSATDNFSPALSPTTAEPDTGPDLFL